ncbi:MAG: DUF5132 domain-containing protein [Thiobacillaceae bacterium]|jgi:hypothetical protein|nr:DUF5132 domain-containing protein [Thiobacillaceae bacterium]
MAGVDDLFKGNIVTGLAVGVGIAILAPVITPILASVGKPLAKSLIKTSMLLYEKGRETAAELGEVFEDLMAEAKVELEGTGATVAAAGAAATTTAETTAAEAVGEAPRPTGDAG